MSDDEVVGDILPTETINQLSKAQEVETSTLQLLCAERDAARAEALKAYKGWDEWWKKWTLVAADHAKLQEEFEELRVTHARTQAQLEATESALQKLVDVVTSHAASNDTISFRGQVLGNALDAAQTALHSFDVRRP